MVSAEKTVVVDPCVPIQNSCCVPCFIQPPVVPSEQVLAYDSSFVGEDLDVRIVLQSRSHSSRTVTQSQKIAKSILMITLHCAAVHIEQSPMTLVIFNHGSSGLVFRT